MFNGDSILVGENLITSAMAKKIRRKTLPNQIWLAHISMEAGYTLADYFESGEYEDVPWTDTKEKFKNAIEVYAMAREFEMEHLEGLAKIRVVRRGLKINSFDVLGMVEDAFRVLKLGKDTWFGEYISAVVKRTFEDASDLSSADDLPAEASTGNSFGKLVLRVAIKFYLEETEPVPACSIASENGLEGTGADNCDSQGGC